MNGHLLRCQSALRAHVRLSTLRAQGLLPPCIWRIHGQAPTLKYLDALPARRDSEVT